VLWSERVSDSWEHATTIQVVVPALDGVVDPEPVTVDVLVSPDTSDRK
jgi:hypothetical protein